MSASKVISQLEGVRQTGPKSFLARCPAHGDKRPSLSIREMDDGLVLVRCWAGCSFDEIITGARLDPSDLFPEKARSIEAELRRGTHKPFPVADVLAATAHEALVASCYARDLANGESLAEADIHRLAIAAGRLLAAAGYSNG